MDTKEDLKAIIDKVSAPQLAEEPSIVLGQQPVSLKRKSEHKHLQTKIRIIDPQVKQEVIDLENFLKAQIGQDAEEDTETSSELDNLYRNLESVIVDLEKKGCRERPREFSRMRKKYNTNFKTSMYQIFRKKFDIYSGLKKKFKNCEKFNYSFDDLCSVCHSVRLRLWNRVKAKIGGECCLYTILTGYRIFNILKSLLALFVFYKTHNDFCIAAQEDLLAASQGVPELSLTAFREAKTRAMQLVSEFETVSMGSKNLDSIKRKIAQYEKEYKIMIAKASSNDSPLDYGDKFPDHKTCQ